VHEGTIWSIKADGTRRRQLTTKRDRRHVAGRLAFIRRSPKGPRISTMRPDGDEHMVVANTLGARDVTWSPYGMHLAFVTAGARENRECLRIVRLDGKGAKTLRCGLHGSGDGPVRGIAWAPNGKSILVGLTDRLSESSTIESRLVRVALDGTTTRGKATGFEPDWQPRG
jgi:hypothetical protein